MNQALLGLPLVDQALGGLDLVAVPFLHRDTECCSIRMIYTDKSGKITIPRFLSAIPINDLYLGLSVNGGTY